MLHSDKNIPLEDRLRDELGNASFLPPPDMWNKIQAELPEKKPLYIRYRWPISAAVFLFALLSTYLFQQQYSASEYFSSHNAVIASNDVLQQNPAAVQPAAIYGQKSYMDGLKESHHTATASVKKDIKQNNTVSAKQTIASQEKQATASNTGSLSADRLTTEAYTPRPAGNVTASGHNKVKKGKKSVTDHPGNTSPGSVIKHFSKSVAQEAVSQQQETFTVKDQKNGAEIAGAEVAQVLSDEAKAEVARIQEEPVRLEPLATALFSDDEAALHGFNNQPKPEKARKVYSLNKGFYIGPLAGYHYTAMTKAAREGVNVSQMNHKATFGSFYGITIGYMFNSRWSLSAEWMYSSTEGQRFTETIGNQSTQKYMDLDYMKFPVVVRYRQQFISGASKIPVTLNFIGGIQYSRLRSKNTFINNELSYFDIYHNKHQWGLLTGTELDFHATNRIFFTLGSRIGFNANANTFPRLRGNNGVDPVSMQIGVYAKINYRIIRK